MNFKIAIDGPAGSGKSTAAKRIAHELGFVYADTGAMYRAMGLYCDELGVDVNDCIAVAHVMPEIKIEVKYNGGEQLVYLNGRNVTDSLRTQKAGMAASAVAAHGVVRERLTALQRKMGEASNIVMDGRDICAYVLPDAQVKVYLDASTLTRAERRCAELAANGVEYDFDKIEQEIMERDIFDKSRAIEPLTVADDAVVIDSDKLNTEQVAAEIIALAHARGLK